MIVSKLVLRLDYQLPANTPTKICCFLKTNKPCLTKRKKNKRKEGKKNNKFCALDLDDCLVPIVTMRDKNNQEENKRDKIKQMLQCYNNIFILKISGDPDMKP